MGLLKFLAPSRYTVFLLLLVGVFTISLNGCRTQISNGFLFDQWTYVEKYSHNSTNITTHFQEEVIVPPSTTFSIEKFLINLAVLLLLFFYFFIFFIKTNFFKKNIQRFGYAFNYVYAFMIYGFVGNLYEIGYDFFVSYSPWEKIMSLILSIPSLVFAPLSWAYMFAELSIYDWLSYANADIYSLQTSENLMANLSAELINRIPYLFYCVLFFLLGLFIYYLKKKSK